MGKGLQKSKGCAGVVGRVRRVASSSRSPTAGQRGAGSTLGAATTLGKDEEKRGRGVAAKRGRKRHGSSGRMLWRFV